jgi:hypothetical protein
MIVQKALAKPQRRSSTLILNLLDAKRLSGTLWSAEQ